MLDCSYVEAVIKWCEENNVELETAADLIKKSSPLKTKIQAEAEEVNILKKTSGTLPL